MTADECKNKKCPAFRGGECYGVALFLGCAGGEKNIDRVKECPRVTKEKRDGK